MRTSRRPAAETADGATGSPIVPPVRAPSPSLRAPRHRAEAASRLKRWLAGSRRAGAKPILRQIAEIGWLRVRRGFTAGEYYAYGFASAECSREQMEAYASNRWHWECQLPVLNEPRWIYAVENKLAFAHRCAAAGLRTARVFGVYHPGFGQTAGGAPLRSTADLYDLAADVPPERLILKPVSGARGGGIFVLECGPGREIRLSGPSDGPEGSAAGVGSVDGSTLPVSRDGVLVQEYLEPHPMLRDLCASASGTVRVVTLRGSDGGVRAVGATLRLGRAESVVDNFSHGGLSVAIDLDSGRLGDGVVRTRLGFTRLDAHPDSDVRVAGRQLPHWEQVVELCREAARCCPGLAGVGWDVVVTPDGPVLLEGNHEWDLVGMQLTGGGYLRPDIRAVLGDRDVPIPEPLN